MKITDGVKRFFAREGYEGGYDGQWKMLHKFANVDDLTSVDCMIDERYRDLPDSVKLNLAKARSLREQGIPLKLQPSMSDSTWEEILYKIITNGAQVLNTTTETIMLPDYVVQGGSLHVGELLRYTVFFSTSTVVTTPGTLTFRLRWGGVAGTVMVTSAAQRPKTTVTTDFVSRLFFLVLIKADPSAAAASRTMGEVHLGQSIGDAQAVQEDMIPQSGSADVNINTGADNALSPTIAFSVATATTQLTTNLAFLESLN